MPMKMVSAHSDNKATEFAIRNQFVTSLMGSFTPRVKININNLISTHEEWHYSLITVISESLIVEFKQSKSGRTFKGLRDKISDKLKRPKTPQELKNLYYLQFTK